MNAVSLVASHRLSIVLGGLTGLVGLIAMFRLISEAFEGPLSTFSLVFVLLAMVPWVVYSGWRARHGRLSVRSVLVIGALCALGLVSVWILTAGAVLALVCSLTAFGIIWVNDWPHRRPRTEERFVRIEELSEAEEEDLDGEQPVGRRSAA